LQASPFVNRSAGTDPWRWLPPALSLRRWPPISAASSERFSMGVRCACAEGHDLGSFRPNRSHFYRWQIETLSSRLTPLLRASVLLALISYFTTRIGSTCITRSARCISWREDKKTRKWRIIAGPTGVKIKKYSRINWIWEAWRRARDSNPRCFRIQASKRAL